MQNHSYENDLDLHGNEQISRTHFYMNGFSSLILKQGHKVLTQRQKAIQKWTILPGHCQDTPTQESAGNTV